MKHDLQLPVSIWNLLPVWHYRNKDEVENIYLYTYVMIAASANSVFLAIGSLRSLVITMATF